MVDPSQLTTAPQSFVVLEELCELEERYVGLVEEQDAEQRKQDAEQLMKQWMTNDYVDGYLMNG